MEPGHGTVAIGLVHLRAAMRFDAGGDPARDRKLEMDGNHLRLHARSRLRGKSCDLQHRARARRRLDRLRIQHADVDRSCAEATKFLILEETTRIPNALMETEM